jgi:alpha-beta hydrolase superfamily lysophospholipase
MAATDNAKPTRDGDDVSPSNGTTRRHESSDPSDLFRSAAIPLWFGPESRPLFGWAHPPSSGICSTGVVLCPPFGLERTSAHYAYRMLAESLSARGVFALRFDYDGTGDSAGSDRDHQRVEAWLSSIAHAVAFTRAAGCSSVVLVGMRLGALMAAQAAVSWSKVDGLVLWDSCRTGREFLRQERAMQVLQFLDDDDHGQEREFPGWSARSEDVHDIELLKIPGAVEFSKRVEKVLVLTRPTATSALPVTLALAQPEVERCEAIGQAELLDVNSNDSKVPQQTIATIVDWISQGFRSPPQQLHLQVTSTATLSEGRHHVIENLVSLGPSGLFGVTTTPAQMEPTSDVPWAIFLNSGIDSHVGPCRLWVRLARQWAALGIPSIRFDLGGLGDSPSEGETPGSVIRVARAFDEIEDVAAAVSPDRPSNILLIGLCSGGYQALDSALSLRSGSPRGVYAINAVLRFTPPEMADGLIDRRRRLCRPASPFSQSSRRLPTSTLQRAFWWATWCVSHAKPLRRRHWLRSLTQAGTDVWCVGGEDETEELKAMLRFTPADHASPAPLITTWRGLDHGLVRGSDRYLVADQLTRRVQRQFGLGLPESHYGAPAEKNSSALTS